MANDALFLDSQEVLGNQGRDVLAKLIDVLARMNALKANLDHLIDGTNFENVATAVNLADVDGVLIGTGDGGDKDAGGEVYHNLLSGALAEMEADTNLQQLISRISYYSS